MEAVAKYDFESTADDELSFRKGQQIKILQMSGNWYKAEVSGSQGFVPKNFIDFHLPSWYQEGATRSDAQEQLMSQPVGAFVIRSSQNKTQGDFSISVRHTRDVQHFKVLQNGKGQYHVWSEKFVSLNQLVEYYKNNSVSRKHQVFLQERKQQQQKRSSDSRPALPASLPIPPRLSYSPTPAPRQQLRGRSDDLPPLPESFPTPLPTPPQSSRSPTPAPRQHKASSTMQVRALYTFQAEDTDELDFRAGDIITVLDCPDKSWWRGQLRGKTGLFPSNFTKPV